MEEKEKYEKVWKHCARYGKDWTNPNLARPYKRFIDAEIKRIATATPYNTVGGITDFGCGNGSSLLYFQSIGLYAQGIEIAKNAVWKRIIPSVYIADLRESFEPLPVPGPAGGFRNLPPTSLGLCADIMEHIPTDDVDKVLGNVASLVTRSCLFGIARNEDIDGKEFGLTLHLTRKDKAWWDERLYAHFDDIEEIKYTDDIYVCWARRSS